MRIKSKTCPKPSIVTRVLLGILVWLLVGTSVQANPITVFAAASLTTVVTEAADAFEQKTGTKTRLSFASSSALARQIEAGAEADLFLSANVKWMDHLLQQGLVREDKQTRRISNALVLISASHLNLLPVETLSIMELENRLGSDGFIAMGDPDHVPVGLYAKQALTDANLWSDLRPRIARADSTRAALAMVERGETPLGIVYQTDADILDTIDILYQFDHSTLDIRYALAVTNQSTNPAAIPFFDFLTSDKGLSLFERHGFVLLETE